MRTARASVACRWLPGLAVAVILCLGGCNEVIAGPATMLDNTAIVTLAPIPRGGEMPIYTVTAVQAWRLQCPAQNAGESMPRLGAALVNFPTVAVELELHGFRARLRCVRPKGATAIDALTVCTFSGIPLGKVDLDQEIALEGFLGQRAGVTFDLGPVPVPAPAGAPADTPPPPSTEIKPRLLLDPVASIRILNHSTRPIAWSSPRGEAVVVKSQERATLPLAETLEALHRTTLEPRHLVAGHLYSAEQDRLFVICQPDYRLTLLTADPDNTVQLPLGDQTHLAIPPPGGRIDIEGAWTLVLDSSGHWRVRLAYTRQGAYPVLVNRGDLPIHWISLVSLSDVVIPEQSWRLIKPLP